MDLLDSIVFEIIVSMVAYWGSCQLELIFQSFEVTYAEINEVKMRVSWGRCVYTQTTTVNCFILGLGVNAMFVLFCVLSQWLRMSSSFAQPQNECIKKSLSKRE